MSKPWNHPANAAAYESEVSIFRCPEFQKGNQGKSNRTTYLAVAAPGGCFRGGEGRALGDITDEHTATLMVIEVSEQHAVPWMSPHDAGEHLLNELTVSTKRPHQNGLHMVFVDGRVARNSAKITPQKLHAMVTIAGGESVRQ